MSDPRVAAIVLAGGASRRFGSDKLAAPVRGRSVLEHTIEAVARVVDEVVVVVTPGDRRPLPPGARRVEDHAAFEGPLAGLVAGLEPGLEDGSDARAIVLVVGGDMPAMRPAVLDLLIGTVRDGAVGAVLDDRATIRPLPAAYRASAARQAARRLLARGERRLRALPGTLDVTVIGEGRWRSLDPDGATLLDIDRPTDLARVDPARASEPPPPPGPAAGSKPA